MDLGTVLHDDHVLTLPAGKTELGERRGRVLEKPLLVLRIDPCPSDDARPVARADLVLHGVDDGVESREVHEAFLDEERLERLHPEREVGRNVLVIVIVVVFLSVHRAG
jgi:hypothetical protein